jgi:hypothetical protein
MCPSVVVYCGMLKIKDAVKTPHGYVGEVREVKVKQSTGDEWVFVRRMCSQAHRWFKSSDCKYLWSSTVTPR